jgi:hypothetical protein
MDRRCLKDARSNCQVTRFAIFAISGRLRELAGFVQAEAVALSKVEWGIQPNAATFLSEIVQYWTAIYLKLGDHQCRTSDQRLERERPLLQLKALIRFSG